MAQETRDLTRKERRTASEARATLWHQSLGLLDCNVLVVVEGPRYLRVTVPMAAAVVDPHDTDFAWVGVYDEEGRVPVMVYCCLDDTSVTCYERVDLRIAPITVGQ